MNDTVGGRIWPSVLADRLAELDHQLRLRHPDLGAPSVPPAELVRIGLALRLLADVCGQDPDPGLARLESVFAALARSLTDVPERTPRLLAGYWPRLASFLEDLLARADRGSPTTELLADPGWDAQAQTLARAGGPLAILDELQDRLEDWVLTWGDRRLDPAVRAQLVRGWVRLRTRADAALTGEGGTGIVPNARP